MRISKYLCFCNICKRITTNNIYEVQSPPNRVVIRTRGIYFSCVGGGVQLLIGFEIRYIVFDPECRFVQ